MRLLTRSRARPARRLSNRALYDGRAREVLAACLETEPGGRRRRARGRTPLAACPVAPSRTTISSLTLAVSHVTLRSAPREPGGALRQEVPLFPARWTAALGLTLAVCGSGCVYVYEPLSGLHRPIVLDTGVANFQDLRLAIRCPSGGGLDPAEAASLCRNVGMLFENQGARVTTTQDLPGESQAGDAEQAAAPTTDLSLELRAHDVRETSDPVSWLLCYGSFTLVPGVTESTFAQDVIIRDGSGFLLISDTLRGRIVRDFGFGTWVGNKVLDLVWRDKRDRLSGDVAKHELSADLYQQLSQLVFNAKMREQVLQEGPAVSAGAVPRSGAP